MLRYSPENAKTKKLYAILQDWLTNGRKVYSLDLLSGHFCPFAKLCKSKVVEHEGKRKIQDGKHTQFRCFSASQEVLYPGVFNLRKNNSDLLRSKKSAKQMFTIMDESKPHNMGVCRIHVGGDMFNQTYFNAWIMMAQNNPNTLFYGYTKSLPYWAKRRVEVEKLHNLVLTASYGGSHDDLIAKENFRFAQVISESWVCERIMKRKNVNKVPRLGTHYDGLAIDHDDSHAALPSKRDESFALLIHGPQPAGSDASKSRSTLKGVGEYNRKDITEGEWANLKKKILSSRKETP